MKNAYTSEIKKEVSPFIMEQKPAKNVLVSKTGMLYEPCNYVYYLPAQQLEDELARFLKMKTGRDLTILLEANEYGYVSLDIKELGDIIRVNNEKMSVREYLESYHDLSLFDSVQAARDIIALYFNLYVNDIAHLQYFEDYDNPANSKVRLSISAGAFEVNQPNETIGGSRVSYRAVSNMLYFLMKAAQEEIDLSLTYPQCSHFEDVMYGSLVEWAEEVEKLACNGDPAFRTFVDLIRNELVEGFYLNEGAQKFIEQISRMFKAVVENPKELVFFKLFERLVSEAESTRNEREKQ